MPQFETLPRRTWTTPVGVDPMTLAERVAAVRSVLAAGADPCDLPVFDVRHATAQALACDFCRGAAVANARAWVGPGEKPYAECPRCGEVNGTVGTVVDASPEADEFRLEDLDGETVTLRWSEVRRMDEYTPPVRG